MGDLEKALDIIVERGRLCVIDIGQRSYVRIQLCANVTERDLLKRMFIGSSTRWTWTAQHIKDLTAIVKGLRLSTTANIHPVTLAIIYEYCESEKGAERWTWAKTLRAHLGGSSKRLCKLRYFPELFPESQF